MDQIVGFRRNVYLEWMDAAAAFCAEVTDLDELRARLDPVVAEQIKSKGNRRIALDIVINIWGKSGETHPALRAEAIELYARSMSASDRLWLHYGMTLLVYDFFRLSVSLIGRTSRYADAITTSELRQKLMAELGQLGSIENAAERITFSLRNWSVLVNTQERHQYKPLRRHFTASTQQLEEWMLAVALTVQPNEALPFADLVRLPELFPFVFTVGVDDLRQSERFVVNRQGVSWDMVQLAHEG